jgi:hypothetical protein
MDQIEIGHGVSTTQYVDSENNKEDSLLNEYREISELESEYIEPK